jgi:hypothetical protein
MRKYLVEKINRKELYLGKVIHCVCSPAINDQLQFGKNVV